MKIVFFVGSIVLFAIVACTLLAVGFQAASSRAAADAERTAEEIRTHVVAGETRTEVYRFLRGAGLTPYDYRFVRGTTISGPDPKRPRDGIGCDLSARAGGAWPYRNEPLPRQPAGCEAEAVSGPVPEPDAELELGGGFDISCGWNTQAVIGFDRRDRVSGVRIIGPRSTCL